jgi:5-methylcytosine-specific restriction endonuclease McrA
LRSAIQERDGDSCRYCGCRVSWSDRRSHVGATYDHVIPRGPETLDNLVVACRRCNTKKGPRTPEEAGMVILEPKSVPRSVSNKSRRGLRPENREQIQRADTEKNEEPSALRASFDSLWAVYPRKVGKDAAYSEFVKLKPDGPLVSVMVGAVERQCQSPQWRKDGGQFIPHPRTWLKQGRWKDSVDLVDTKPMSDFDRQREANHQRAIAQQIEYARRREQAS